LKVRPFVGVCSLPEFRLAPHRVTIDMDALFTELRGCSSDSLLGIDCKCHGVNYV
jgi:hypothetical protein